RLQVRRQIRVPRWPSSDSVDTSLHLADDTCATPPFQTRGATMTHSRRKSPKTTVTTRTRAAAAAKSASAESLKPAHVVRLFANLPGDVALKILAPGTRGTPRFVAELDSVRMLFVASAIKTSVLCEALRQADSATIGEDLEHVPITLDSTIWSPGSPTFDPPKVTGVVSERTAAEAMITRSDNT